MGGAVFGSVGAAVFGSVGATVAWVVVAVEVGLMSLVQSTL